MSDEREKAAQALMNLVQSYASLMGRLLDGVRADMQETVDNVMVQLSKLNAASKEQKEKANANPLKGVEVTDATALDGVTVNEKAKEEFLSGVQSLDFMDARIQKLVVMMVGTLSSEDIVGQRIKHTRYTIETLGGSLKDVSEAFQDKFNRESIEHMSHQSSKKVYDNYTMEEERKLFRKVFGKAP